MALYRTYRPASFAEVVGQEHVTDPLCRALDSGRINHAYLFSGPRGCGKTSSARILARSLNCVEGPTSTPCGVCPSCIALAPGGPGNLDVIELDAASHGGVDDTRDLREKAFYAPAESRYRVFIVDEAHMVTVAGFNALLKIVEEPPEHLIFIFATTEPEKVLPTIRSRTHHYPFRLLPPAMMRGLLERICAAEGVTVQPPVYPLVIRAGGGSPRDSLSVLDQLLAGAGDDGVTYDRALALLGATDVALIDSAVDALAAGDGAALFSAVEQVVDSGHDPRRFSTDLLDRLRDLIVLQAVPDAATRGLVEAPEGELERIVAQSQAIGAATLTRFAETVHASLGEMRGTTSPRLLLEVMCARMLLPSATDAESAVLQRVERLEQQLASGVAISAPAPAAPRAPADPGREPVSESAEPLKYVRKSQQSSAPEQAAPEPIATTESAPDPVAELVVDQPDPVPVDPEPVASAPAPIADEPIVEQPAEPETPASEVMEPEAAEPEPVSPESFSEPSPPESEPEPELVVEPSVIEEPPAEPELVAPASGPEPVAQQAGSDSSSAVSLDEAKRQWNDIRSAVKSKRFPAMLSAAAVADLSDGVLVIAHPNEGLAARLQSEAADLLADAVREVLGVQLGVRVVAGSAAASQGPAQQATKPQRQQQTFTRPSRPDAPPPEPDAEPEYIEPPVADEDLSEAEVGEMIAGARDSAPDPRTDPDRVAMELLASELGAKPID